MSRRTNTRTVAALAVAAVLAAGASSALAGGDPATPAPAVPAADGAVAPIGAVQPDQSAALKVFRRPATARDAVPEDVSDDVASPARFGRNPELARAVSTPAGKGWIVPGRDTVCLVVPDPVDGYGTSCAPTATVVRQGLDVQVVGPGTSFSVSLVPDGGYVVVTRDDASTDVLRPDATGIVAAETDDASQVTAVTDDGRGTTPVPDADGSVAGNG